MLLYLLLALPASIVMTLLLSDLSVVLKLTNLIILWFLDALVWFLAIFFLLEGFKYQDSEKEILRDLGDKFELS